MTLPEIKEKRYITEADSIVFFENNLVTLTLKDGNTYEGVEPRRLFAVNRPDTYITLLDRNGSEIAIIRSMKDLNKESFEAVQNSLNDFYLVPQITKILSVTVKYGNIHWKVETDRGIKKFDIKNRNHDIKVFPDGCIRIRDADDNRYVIPNHKDLDRHSRKLLLTDL